MSKKRLLSDRQKRIKAGDIAKAADIAKYFNWFSDAKKELLREDYRFVCATRVSFRHQEKNGYLDSQVERLKKFLELQGLSDKIYSIKKITCSAFNSESHKAPLGYTKPHYPQLERIAFRVTQQEKTDQVKIALLFEDVSRAIRPDGYDYNRDAPLTKTELREFAKITQNLKVVTICSPTSSLQDVAEYRTIYDRFYNHNTYPGWTKDRRALYEPIVVNMRSEKDKYGKPKYSYGEIAKKLNLPIELVRSWCRKAKMKGLL